MGDSNTQGRLKPDKGLTRGEYVEKAKGVLDTMLEDHQAQTGVGDNELHDEEYWRQEFESAMHNI